MSSSSSLDKQAFYRDERVSDTTYGCLYVPVVTTNVILIHNASQKVKLSTAENAGTSLAG